MARAAIELGLPLLAICRGHQVLNVALGGTLVQHIDEHRFIHHEVRAHARARWPPPPSARRPRSATRCTTRRSSGSATASSCPGWAEDGTIEAVELPGRWVARRAVAPGGHRRARRRPAAAVRRLRRRLPPRPVSAEPWPARIRQTSVQRIGGRAAVSWSVKTSAYVSPGWWGKSSSTASSNSMPRPGPPGIAVDAVDDPAQRQLGRQTCRRAAGADRCPTRSSATPAAAPTAGWRRGRSRSARRRAG